MRSDLMVQPKDELNSELLRLVTVWDNTWPKTAVAPPAQTPYKLKEEKGSITSTNNLLISKFGTLTDQKIRTPITSELKQFRFPLVEQAETLRQQLLEKGKKICNENDFPTGIDTKTREQAIIAAMVLTGFNPETQEEIQNTANDIACNLATNGYIQLVQFACPIVVPLRMKFGNKPLEYVSMSATGQKALNEVNKGTERQGRRLTDIYKIFKFLDLPVKTTIILGDDDEAAYLLPGFRDDLLPVTQRPGYKTRMQAQAIDFQNRLNKDPNYGNNIDVLIWSEMDQTQFPDYLPKNLKLQLQEKYRAILADPLRFFTEDDIQTEMARTSDLLKEDGYYEGAFGTPDEEQLRQIVIQKLAWYSYQGALIEVFYPFGVLLMNETPVELRKKMVRGITGKGIAIATPYPLN